MKSNDRHRQLLSMIKKSPGIKSNGGISLDANRASTTRENSPRTKFDSLYTPGSLINISAGLENVYYVGKRPANAQVSAYNNLSVDQILTEYNPEFSIRENSRSSSQNSNVKKRKHYAYTKPEAPDFEEISLETPGPNAYRVINDTIEFNLKAKPGITLKGRDPLPSPEGSRILNEDELKPPGPATYDPQPSQRYKRNVFSIPKGKRDYLDQQLLKVPASNYYHPEKAYKVCGTALIKQPVGKQHDEKKKDDGPGPGDYFTFLKKTECVRHRFPMAERFHSIDHARYSDKVSPLYYKPDVSSIKQAVPRTRIGKADRFQPDIDKHVPGVGFYPVSLDGLSKQTFSFCKQRRFLRKITNVVYALHSSRSEL